MYTANVYQSPLPSFETQIINPNLNSMISVNHEIGDEFQPANGEIIILLIVSLV